MLRKKIEDKRKSMLFNIQLLAGEEGAPPPAGGEEGNPPTDPPSEPTFDDILKNPKHQSEFEKKIAKALETAKGKWETDYNAKLENAKTEAEKLAKMNADEKAKYAEQKRIADLEKREKDITTRELQATAKTTLVDKGLPMELFEILNYEDADTCNKSIEAVEKAFQSAVEKAVNEKLRGKEVPKGGKGQPVDTSKMTYTELCEYMAANPDAQI